MSNIQSLIFIAMLFCHIVDDFCLQQFSLARLKQKQWWQENAPDSLYKLDYTVALVVHGLSWAIMISIPLIVYVFINNIENGMTYIVISIVINMFIHGIVDNLKANKHKINLQIDQLIHLLQVWLTFVIFFMFISR